MTVSPTVRRLSVATSTGDSREDAEVSLIVVTSDPTPAADALAAYTAADASRAPHYHIAADGALVGLVDEDRAANHAGLALIDSRWRSVDKIALSVVVEHSPGGAYPAAVLSALHELLADLKARYNLGADAVVRWESEAQGGDSEKGFILALDLPPAPVLLLPLEDDVFGSGGDDDAVPCVAPPVEDEDGVLGGGPDFASDPALAERFYTFLLQETYRHRGGGYQGNWAFHRFAPKFGSGAPVAAVSNASNEVKVDGKTFGYQVFGTDTVFNEIPQWGAVQSLNELLGGKIPAGGHARALLEASFKATGQQFHDNWRFHIDSVAKKLGPPLSASYTTTIDGKQVNLQVFAGDTLYCFPPNYGTAMALSETAPGNLANGLWAEAYKPSGAAYDPGSAFQQQAAAAKLGSPLTGVYQVSFEGTNFMVQVFARDTLFAGPDGAIQRLGDLPKPASIANWQPAKPAAPAAPAPAAPSAPAAGQPSGGSPDDAMSDRRPVFRILPVAGQPRISQFYGFTKYSKQRTDIYGQTQARHSGLDFGAPEGTKLISVGHGIVICTMANCPFGASKPGSIVVRYGSVYALYGHARASFVKKGQLISPGDVIGEVGTFVGPHLHFELRPVPKNMLGNRDPNQNPVNPGVALNPIIYFSDDLKPYFEQQYAKLRGTVGEFCCGGLHDQPDTTFGGALDQRGCTN